MKHDDDLEKISNVCNSFLCSKQITQFSFKISRLSWTFHVSIISQKISISSGLKISQHQMDLDGPGRTRMDPDRPGRTRTDPDRPGQARMNLNRPGRTRRDLNRPRWTRTDPDGPGRTGMDPGRTWMNPDRSGVLIGSKWFFQTLELMTVEYALAAQSPKTFRLFFKVLPDNLHVCRNLHGLQYMVDLWYSILIGL